MKFHLGYISKTAKVVAKATEDIFFDKYVVDSLIRHSNADWGEISNSEKQSNNAGLKRSMTVYSIFRSENYPDIVIITPEERSATVVMFFEELLKGGSQILKY